MKILVTENIILAGKPCDAGTVVDIAKCLALPLVGDGKASADAARIVQAEAAAAPAAVPSGPPSAAPGAGGAPESTPVS